MKLQCKNLQRGSFLGFGNTMLISMLTQICSGSQTERISMLRMVLENKGIVVAGSHYDLHTEPSSRAVAGVHGNGLSDADDQPQRDSVEDPVDDGLHL